MAVDELDVDDEYMDVSPPNIVNNCLAIFSPEMKSFGTGFLIDSKGTFLSAGHVFKNSRVSHYAYYKNVKYTYETIFIEYMECGAYPLGSQYCRDLFVGRLLNFHKDIDASFHLKESSLLGINDELLAIGYITEINNFFEESQMIDDTSLYLHKIHIQRCSPEDIINRNNYKKMDGRLAMRNIKTIRIDNVERYHGLSGGPVFRNKEIYGVLIAEMFITSEYIMNILRGL